MDEYLKIIITSVISGAVFSAILAIVFKRKTETITAEIKNQFEISLLRQKTGQLWKEKAITELYGPLNFLFSRTKMAFDRYTAKNLYLEAKVMKESNEKIRDLLLEKAYLISPELTNNANELVKHYDVWLEEFQKIRESENTDHNPPDFVLLDQKGILFPKKQKKIFRKNIENFGKNYTPFRIRS